MLITMPDMMGMPSIWAQQSTLPSGGSMQQEAIPYKQQQQQQDVSKLTKWLGLDFEDEAPPEHQTYERTGNFQASENDSTISSTPISSLQGNGTNNYSCGQSELSSTSVDEQQNHSSIKEQMVANKQQYWNVNANPFRPARAFQPKNVGGIPPHLQPPQQFPPMNSMGSAFPFNVPIVGQQNYGHPQNNYNMRFSPFQPNAGFRDQFQQNFSTPVMQDGGDNVWQNPDAEYRRWQQYTGTAVWGDPPFEKGTTEGVLEPIHRWTEFSDDDCFDMFERVSKLEKEIAAKPNQHHRQSPATIGWGDQPAITSGTYGRIQSFQAPTFGSTNYPNPMVNCQTNPQFGGEQQMFGGGGFGNGFGAGGRIGGTNRIGGRTNSTASKWASYGTGTTATIGQQQFPMATTTPSNESTMAMMGMGGGFEGQMMPNGNGGGNGSTAPFFPTTTTMPTENEGGFLATTPMTMTTQSNVLLNMSTAAIFPPLLCSGPLYPVW